MKGGEIELFSQLLLESRTGAYIEWLDNELIMTANNKHTYGFTISIIFRKRKPSQPKNLSYPLESGNLFSLVG